MNKKTEIDINGKIYIVPDIILKEFKIYAKEMDKRDIEIAALRQYIYNYLGTHAKA